MMAPLALAASVVFQSVITTSLGLSLNEADSLLMLLCAVSATQVCAVWTRRGSRGVPWRGPSKAALISLNVWTAVSFISFFAGVAVYSAAVVFTLEAACAPLGLLVWTQLGGRNRRSHQRSGPPQCWAACLLAVLGASLVAVIALSDPSRMRELCVAGVLGVLAGVAAGRVASLSRELNRCGFGAAQVMSQRFYLTALAALAALVTLVPARLVAPPALPVGVIAAAALTSIVAPIYLSQYAMQGLEPSTVTAALATMPAIAIAVELVAGRSVGWIVLLLGALLVPANLLLILAQAKGLAPLTARQSEMGNR